MKYPSFLVLLTIALLAGHCGEPPAVMATASGTVRAGNFLVQYERTGQGNPVLLLHAGLQDHTMWAEQVKALAGRYEVITIDLPYHGSTTGQDTTLLGADVVRILLDSLQIRRASIVGLSMGAMVGLDFVIGYPERVEKVVLMGPGLNGYEKEHAPDSVSMAWDRRFDKAWNAGDTVRAALEFARTWAEGIYRSNDSLKAPYSQTVYQTALGNLRRHKLLGWPRLQMHPPAIDGLTSIRVPVLIIDGDKDLPVIGACSGYLAAHIRGARRERLPGVAHMINLEEPAKVDSLLLGFLSKE